MLSEARESGERSQKHNNLHSVTPFSKYLALLLFIALPFIGGWVGYQQALTEAGPEAARQASPPRLEWIFSEPCVDRDAPSTPPVQFDADTVTFAFLPDISWGFKADYYDYIANTEKALSLVDDRDVDFMVLGGDNVFDNGDLSGLYKVVENVGIPHYWTIGNHDTPHAALKAWLLCQGHDEARTPYAWEAAGLTFIILDSAGGEGRNEISEAQLTWLRETEWERPLVLFVHHPTGGSISRDSDYLKNKEAFLDVIEGLDVLAVFNGHDHWGEFVEEIDGALYVNAPSVVPERGEGEANKVTFVTYENGELEVEFALVGGD